MLRTLHKYIFKEMAKNFLLTTIGLTAVLTTCGGLYNMTQLPNVGLIETLMLMLLVIPMCSSITLPIAALFSAASTYGRLAADNEFVAIRASGINTHRMLLPCVVISLVSGALTFAVFNLVIPRFFKQLHAVSRVNIMDYAVQTLEAGDRMEFQGQMITAGSVLPVSTTAGQEGNDAVIVNDVVFLEEDGDEFKRVGVAPSAAVKFDMSQHHPQIMAELSGLQVLDLTGEGRYSEHGEERLGPLELKAGLRMRPKYLYLNELFKYRRQPELVIDKLQREINRTRHMVTGQLTLDYFHDLFARGGQAELAGGDVRLILHGARPQIGSDMMMGQRWMDIEAVTVSEWIDGHRVEYAAERARLELRIEDRGPAQVAIQLHNGTQQYEGAESQQFRVRELDPVDLPTDVATAITDKYTNEVLWSKTELPEFGADVDKQRKRLRKRRKRYVHEFHSEIHLRTVYSISVIFLAVLGAALSVIFRGGQLLVAFGISFLPTLGVILTTILGKGVAKSVLIPGLAIMWGGLVAVIVLDFVVLKKYYPR